MSLSQHARREEATERTDTDAQSSPEELIELLDAEYTRDILEAIRNEPMGARDLSETCGASRPTVYRRLNRLQDAGLVETRMAYDADGHHRTVFEATLRTISVDVTDSGLDVTVTTEPSERSSAGPGRHSPGE